MPDEIETALIRLKAIWEAMGKTQHPGSRPLISLEQFFLHSKGEADLWYNVWPYPEEIDQYEFHRSIRARADVWDVLISITQLDTVPPLNKVQFEENGGFDWPNSDHTLIITTADESTIRSWFPEAVQPDRIDIGDRSGTRWGAPSFVPEDYHQAWLWYD